jgi:hypothetical protein
MYKYEELLRRWKKWTEKKQYLESFRFLNSISEKRRLAKVTTCNKRLDEINKELGR